MIVIPAPKRMERHGTRTLGLDETLRIELRHSGDAQPPATAARLLAERLRQLWRGRVELRESSPRNAGTAANTSESGKAFTFLLDVSSQTGETYAIRSDRHRIRLSAGPSGILHAVQTMLQLLDGPPDSARLNVPLADIDDEPDVPVRGIFAECHWGSDLMQLADWQSMIDEMASLKLNTLCLGIYGCWYRSHPEEDGSDPYFLFAPVIDHPERMPASRIRYYDPTAGAMTVKEYLPVIYQQDLLGSIIAYAAERGIRVVPLFNGPGHSHLLPKLYPQIASVDGTGRPTESGYTLTRPDTLPMLKRICTRIVERYMKPYGLTWFHIGMDEVSRWSRADLAKHTQRELLCLYLTEMARHLLDLGMEKIVFWHDCLYEWTGFDDDFQRMLKQFDLADKIVIHWWKYGEPAIGIREIRGADKWVAPSTGFTPSVAYQDYLDNIDMMVEDGIEDGPLHGVVSYMVYSPALHRNTAFLAEKSWNTSARVDAFEMAYARSQAQTRPDLYAKGLASMRKVFGYSASFALLTELQAYRGDKRSDIAYPGRLIASIRAAAGTRRAYEILLILLRNSLQLFNRAEPKPGKRGIEIDRFECKRTEAVIDAVLLIADVADRYKQIRQAPVSERGELKELCRRLERGQQAFEAMMLEMQRQMPHYLVPDGLRSFTCLREALRRTSEEIGALASDPGVRSGAKQLPELGQFENRSAKLVSNASS